MNNNFILSLSSTPNDNTSVKLETPQQAADWGKNIVLQSVTKSPLYILKTFWPILLIFLLAFIIKIVSQEKKHKEYRRDKNRLKWKKQPPN